MVLLAVLSLALDKRKPNWFKDHPLYTFRACGQAGLAQGLLALPSLATAVFIATRSWWWQQAARLFIASSFQVLAWFSWTAAAPSRPRQSAIATTDTGVPTARVQNRPHPQATITRPFLAAVAAGCVLSALSALLHAAHPPPPSSPHLLLPGSVFELPREITASAWAQQVALLLATVPALDHLATDLPRSFTPGEAGVVLQALLALVAGSCTYIIAALRHGIAHALWSPHVVQPDPGMHVPAFCMLVLFWVLLLAACSAVALGADGAGLHFGEHLRSSAVGRGQQGMEGEAASRLDTNSILDTAGRGDQLERLLGTGIRVGAAVGATLCFGMLIDLALWVLGRFVAASSHARLATLAYWFGCLAVAVPLLYALSKASAAREQQHRQQQEQQSQQSEGNAASCSGSGSRSAESTGPGAPPGSATQHRNKSLSAKGPVEKEKKVGQSCEGARPRRSLAAALLRALAVPHIVMRKGYHLLAILLFLPAFGWDVRMLQASLAVAGAVLVMAELLRCLGPPPVRCAIGGFMADFADARDSGPIYVTHFTLLLGIAVPVWLCEPVCGAAAGAMMAGLYGSEAAEPLSPPPPAGDGGGSGPLAPPLSAAAARLLPSCRTVLGLSGLVSLGSGDTAAACVGFLLGRWRLFRGGKKTWEGTLSGAAAMLASWAVVVWWMDLRWAVGWGMWAALAAVTGGVALLEAVTQQLDNVMVPLYYLTHLVLTMTGN